MLLWCPRWPGACCVVLKTHWPEQVRWVWCQLLWGHQTTQWGVPPCVCNCVGHHSSSEPWQSFISEYRHQHGHWVDEQSCQSCFAGLSPVKRSRSQESEGETPAKRTRWVSPCMEECVAHVEWFVEDCLLPSWPLLRAYLVWCLLASALRLLRTWNR